MKGYSKTSRRQMTDDFGYPLVRVEWYDSIGVGSHWEVISDAKVKPLVCVSVGYMIEKGKTIVIVPHMHGDRDDIGAKMSGCGDMAIPSCAVKSITNLVVQE